MIVFIRSNDANPDPRLQKYIDFCNLKGIIYHIYAWDRLSEGFVDDESHTYFRKKASYGGGVKNILNILSWNAFLIYEIYKIKNTMNILHCCDLDTGVVGFIFKSKKIKFIYDIFDWYGDSRKGFLSNILKRIEKFIVKKSDHTIICDEGRIKQMGFEPSSYSVLYNIPSNLNDITINPKNKNKNKNITISYVGILAKDRHLNVILNIVKYIDMNQLNIEIKVAGFGDMSNCFLDASVKYECLSFYGKVNYDKAKEIILNSNLMFAFYDINVTNNIYASPNKFFESLAFQTPLITNAGTLLSNKVSCYNTGYIINNISDNNEIINLLENLAITDIENKNINCIRLWCDDYETFVSNYLECTYYKLIK